MAGKASRFAVLRIEDDSEEEFQPVASNNKKTQKGGPSKSPNTSNAPAGLIVHEVEKKRRSNPKKRQAFVDEPLTRGQSQPQSSVSPKGNEGNSDAELEKALQESLLFAEAQGTTNLSQAPAKSQPKTPVEEEVVFPPGGSKTMEVYVSLLKDQLTRVRSDLQMEQDKSRKFETDTNKYRDRFRKMLDILKEAELNDKATLLHEKEQRDKVIADMGEQLKSLQQENEKLRGRLSRFEKP